MTSFKLLGQLLIFGVYTVFGDMLSHICHGINYRTDASRITKHEHFEHLEICKETLGIICILM